MAKLSKKKLSEQGKKITGAAKRIRKENPGMKWQTAMKRAGSEYRRKKK